jgi:KUP system potassium uptake protein
MFLFQQRLPGLRRSSAASSWRSPAARRSTPTWVISGKPIQAAWFCLVFPCLTLNYLGQGAMVLAHPRSRQPVLGLPELAYWPVLPWSATMATIIASQAVITGAFSLTQQAVQLGLLPRMASAAPPRPRPARSMCRRSTPCLLIGVLSCCCCFKTPPALAAAYGIAVTATMLVDTLLAWFVVRRLWKWNIMLALTMAVVPLMASTSSSSAPIS